MKSQSIVQALKFLMFSISAGVIEAVTFTALDFITKWTYWPCYLCALTLSVIWNFTLNREFTFKSANNVPIAMMKVLGYYCIFTPLSTVGGNFLTNLGWNEYIVLILTMVINLVTEFLYDKYFVFRGSINTSERGRYEKNSL